MLRPVLLLAFGLAFAGSVQAQTLEPLDPWVREVHQQLWLYRISLDLTDLSHNLVTGSLDAGERETVMAELEGGSSYSFLDVCDNDCTDIDLRVKTRSGTTLVEDVELDDFPLCEMSVAGEGTMNLRGRGDHGELRHRAVQLRRGRVRAVAIIPSEGRAPNGALSVARLILSGHPSEMRQNAIKQESS